MNTTVEATIVIEMNGQKLTMNMSEAKELVNKLANITGQDIPKVTYIPSPRWDYWTNDKPIIKYLEDDQTHLSDPWVSSDSNIYVSS